jgi:hypothetical protein
MGIFGLLRYEVTGESKQVCILHHSMYSSSNKFRVNKIKEEEVGGVNGLMGHTNTKKSSV